MKNTIQVILALIALVLSVTTQASPVKDALSAYKEKQYHRAAFSILNSATNLDSLAVTDKLKIAIVFLNNATLHRDIAVKAKKTQLVFLQSLLSEQDKDPSVFIDLYLSELHIHHGNLEKAKSHLEKFLAQSNINDNYRNLAKVFQAWISLKTGNETEFQQISNSVAKSHLIIDLAISFVKSLEGLKIENYNSLDEQIGKTFIAGNLAMSSRVANYALRLLVDHQSLESARAIYNRLPMHAPSHVEKITPVKIINFYESTLAETLYEFYKEYAKHLLRQVSTDKKYGDIATFYLSELHIIEKNKAEAKTFVNKVKNLRMLPKSLSPLKDIRANAHGFLDGKHSRAYQVWEEAVDNDKKDPALIADAILMCIYVDGNCPTLIQKGQLAAEAGRSKRFEDLSTYVGRYFLARNLDGKALRLMEYALDRSNVNSLLANEPILLLNLAEAYRTNKKYSKSLQVYFSLGQNFPIMRQIQDAVQGEYLFQQRSSGQSNVF